jgi:hypothetical protein
MSIFRTEKDKEEFVRIFRKITMSGDINDDRAIEKIIRNNPHFFRQPSADELKKSFHAVMNDEIRARAQTTNRLADGIFANALPTNKNPS